MLYCPPDVISAVQSWLTALSLHFLMIRAVRKMELIYQILIKVINNMKRELHLCFNESFNKIRQRCRYLPFDNLFFQRFLPFDVFPVDLLSHSTFCPSTFFTVGFFYCTSTFCRLIQYSLLNPTPLPFLILVDTFPGANFPSGKIFYLP